eukprot:TRINITY_DN44961_c0_g1_i1.p1 TRINITY_DN44961_c0_g1~~TRINITY_DN44961_c0_g1_i1.p1  ORF type:complete len:416 (+),score=72.10 TRINITY_DN44961_c0_g1_i1:174-1421(+)
MAPLRRRHCSGRRPWCPVTFAWVLLRPTADAARDATTAEAATARPKTGPQQCPAKDAWRWHIFQTPQTAPEFRFPRRRRLKNAAAALAEEAEPCWKERDRTFEEEGLFCNGRWLGVQVLQAPEDLLYLQQVITRLRPQVVLETGTYRGGLAYFIASLFSQLGLAKSKVVTMDVFPLDANYHNMDNHPLCPVCLDCVKAYETDLWRRHVVFFEGNSLRQYGEVKRFVAKLHEQDGRWGPTLLSLDAQHDYGGTLLEMHHYGPLVDPGSYMVVQDARLDSTYGMAGPLAAGARLLEDGPSQWLWDRDVEVFGHTQHLWIRRLTWGEPVSLQFAALSTNFVAWNPFEIAAEDAVCVGGEPLHEVGFQDSAYECQAVCLRVPDKACLFISYSLKLGFCTLRRDCPHQVALKTATIYARQ